MDKECCFYVITNAVCMGFNGGMACINWNHPGLFVIDITLVGFNFDIILWVLAHGIVSDLRKIHGLP